MKRTCCNLGFLLAIGLLAAACGGTNPVLSDGPANQTPTPTAPAVRSAVPAAPPTGAASGLPQPLATLSAAALSPAPTTPTWMPTPTAEPLPTPLAIQAHSAHVTPGRAYDFVLYTHCGIDFEVDFDGGFWD